jgi:GH15 family glucan-1,4-alpha-glucosidase
MPLCSNAWKLAASAAITLTSTALTPAVARAEQRTWPFLTTGNGHGFQVYDADKKKIVQFLEHPYRYLRAGANQQSYGPGRRNLAYDFTFGVKGGWFSEATAVDEPFFLDQDNIIAAHGSIGGQRVEQYFFAPFGYEGNAMVALVHAPGASDAFALFNFHMGDAANPTEPGANGEALRFNAGANAIVETGPGGGAMVYVALSGLDKKDCQGVFGAVKAGQDLGDNATCAGNDVVPAMQKKLGADGWWAVAAQFVDDPNDADAAANALKTWANGRTPQKILDDAKAEWEAWRKPPKAEVALCSDDEKKLWRMSEAVLRMGQVREPNIPGRRNHGMILASLPVGEWHTGWVRDAEYAIVALARMGHFEEAKKGLDFLINAAPVGTYKQYVSNQDYLISVVRYFGTGQEEADWDQAGPNIETDGWGMVLWAARQYIEASGDTSWLSQTIDDVDGKRQRFGTQVYDALVNGIAKPLEGNLEANGLVKADSSIWEVHEANKKHYAYTTMSAARGFCDLAAIAQKAGKPDAQKYQQLSQKIKTAFLGAFVDPQGALAGSLEELSTGRYLDAAVVEAFTWNILPDFKNDTAKSTLDALEKLRVDSGGYKRNDDAKGSYDNNEWILIDFRMADANRRAGRPQVADAIFATLVKKAAANFYLLPELYNAVKEDGEIGKYTGSIPMVGYGGGAYVLTVLDRAGLIEPNDCGDGKGMTLPALTCAGVSTSPGGGPGGPGADGGTTDPNAPPGADQIPYVAACLCKVQADRHLPAGAVGLAAIPVLLLLRRRRR